MGEVLSLLIPAGATGKVVSKLEIIAHLKNTKLLKAGARAVLTAKETALAATKMCFVADTLVKTLGDERINIQDVSADMELWSRNEQTGEESLKRVVQTFTTHPTELYRLTYQVRGPPGSAQQGSPLSPRAESETLGVTAPHPFWVCNNEPPGFIAAEDLRVGDELFIGEGRGAVVTGKVLEHAPPGQTFTTYNFEVADFHTYFAGESSVWVHNHGVAPCMLARSTIEAMVKRGEATWDAFRGTLTKASPGEIGSRTRLKIFNETRQKYLTDAQWQTGTPPWENLPRQLRGLGPVGSNSYWDQINGVAGNPKLLGNNLKATGIEAPWGGSDGSLAAHHIVAAGEQYPSAIATRKILADAGVDVNEAANGVFLPRNAVDSDLGKAIHSGRHSEDYSRAVLARLEPLAGNAPALREELQKIADHLVNVGWLP